MAITLKDLEISLYKFRPHFNIKKVRDMKFEYVERSGKLIVRSRAKPSKPGREYKQRIVFDTPPVYEDEKVQRSKMVWIRQRQGGHQILVHKPTRTGTPIRVRCNCADFAWTFAWADSLKHCLSGAMFKLKKPKGVRPPRNPKKRIGYCKHIAGALEELKRRKVLRKV